MYMQRTRIQRAIVNCQAWSLARGVYHHITYCNKPDRGGHFFGVGTAANLSPKRFARAADRCANCKSADPVFPSTSKQNRITGRFWDETFKNPSAAKFPRATGIVEESAAVFQGEADA
jgi:hypothetical protein